MIDIKNTLISAENIKKISSTRTYYGGHYCYCIEIEYFFDTKPVLISIDNSEEYYKLKEEILKQLDRLKGE